MSTESSTFVTAENLERRLSKISVLSRDLSNISTNEEDEEELDRDLSATKYWKDYHDYFSKLSSIKKEIDEFKNMNNEYTGMESFDSDKYHLMQKGLKKAIDDTNSSYKEFSGINYEYIN